MQTIAQLSPTKILYVLMWLRSFAVLGQWVVLALASGLLAFDLPLEMMIPATLLLVCWNGIVYWRLQREWLATSAEVFLNLIVDSSILTYLLFWAGGATNPFVFIYLIPIAVAAASLPVRYAWYMSLLSALFYTLLMRYYIPLPPVENHFFNGAFDLHIFGMWVNFILSAVLMTIFIAGISKAVQQRDQSLARAREEALKSERIVAMGTLAAGVAHEISTPLSTMTMLVEELTAELNQNQRANEDLLLLRKQIDVCKEKLREMLANNGHTRSEGGVALSVHDFIERLLDQWQVIRPEIRLDQHFCEPFENPIIVAEQTISQSIINLLNNAADASIENSYDEVAIEISCSQQQLLITIDDEGRGITQQQAEQAGEVSFSTKKEGFGIGLVLSNASLSRFGGNVLLNNRQGRGTRTEIRLPLKELSLSESNLT
ncbi:MAG: ATP-binding protein [Candidatus Polarisedimenticolaceae bacterium]|nr:ATP-binding protein [Candidatus Polarisedimenticolaceae bacterium]